MSFTETQIAELCQKSDDVFADAPTRIKNVLKYGTFDFGARDMYYLGQLLAHTEQDFIQKIPGSSKKTAAYISQKLQERGYALGALAGFKQDLVISYAETPPVSEFGGRLRELPVKGPIDLSILPRATEKETDAAWVKAHFPSYQQDIPEQFIAAALGDPRVERKLKAFLDMTRQVAAEKLSREGGPS